MVPAVMAMPAAMPAMMMMASPPHFGGIRLDILLYRRGGAGIAERQRLCVFRRSGENEQRANGHKPDYFRHLHLRSPWVHVSRIDATQFTS
jgi:hypothetical protein